MAALVAECAAELPSPFGYPDVRRWFDAKYPKVQDGTLRAFLIALCANDPSKRHHPSYRRKQPVVFKLGPGKLVPYEVQVHGAFDEFGIEVGDGLLPVDPTVGGDAEIDDEATMEFVLEAYLEEFLHSNWTRVDWGRPLEIYDGGDGHQFATPVGRMDFLCIDKATGALVVIELKRGRPGDQVIGQLARYMGWARAELATGGQQVEGIVVAHEIDNKLRYAAAALPGTSLLEYGITFALRDASAMG